MTSLGRVGGRRHRRRRGSRRRRRHASPRPAIGGDGPRGNGGGGGGLRGYAGAAFASRPEALADVRSCLAASFLARPFSSLPPLAPDAVAAGGSAAGETRTPPPPHRCWTRRGRFARRRWRGGRESIPRGWRTPWLGILDDAIDAGDPRERENATLDAPESDAERTRPRFPRRQTRRRRRRLRKPRVVRIRCTAPRDAAERVRAALLHPAPPRSTPRRARGDARVRSSRGGDVLVAHRLARREEDAGTRRSRSTVVGGAIGSTRAAAAAVAPLAATRGRARGARAARARARERGRGATPGGDGRARFGVGGARRTHADGSSARPRGDAPRASRPVRRRVVVSSVAPNPQLLALAGLARARDARRRERQGRRRWCRRGARRVVGGDGIDARRRVTNRAGRRHAFGMVRGSGRGCRGRLRRARTRRTVSLAFHGLPRDARAAAAAEMMAAFAGEGVGERRRAGGGQGGAAQRAIASALRATLRAVSDVAQDAREAHRSR